MAMQFFLAKTEPGEYSIDDLAKKGQDQWDGVTNPVAVKNIKLMKVKDRVIIYHSGKNPSLVGLVEVVKVAEVDPKNPKSWVPVFKFLKRFNRLVSLEEIKSSHLFDDWALVKQGRLSTMVVPASFINWLKSNNVEID